MEYRPIKNNITKLQRTDGDIKYLVVHDTANYDRDAGVEMHWQFFNRQNRKASADIFVDDKKILKFNDWYTGYSWAVGDDEDDLDDGINNRNSISLEMCVNDDSDYQTMLNNTVKAILEIKRELPHIQICRHFDASGKICPGHMYGNNWRLWKEFLERINQEANDLTEEQTNALIQKALNRFKEDHVITDHSNSEWAKKQLVDAKLCGILKSEHSPNELISMPVMISMLLNTVQTLSERLDVVLSEPSKIDAKKATN